MRGRALILLLIFVQLHYSLCAIISLYNIGREIWKLYSIIDAIENDTSLNFKQLFISENGFNGEIRKQFGVIEKRIRDLGESMSFGMTRESLKPLQSHLLLFRDLDIVEIFVQSINKNYEEFYRYMTGAIPYSEEKFRNFMQKLTINVEGSTVVLRRTLVDDKVSAGRKNLVSLIGDYATSEQAEICNGPQMLSSILVQLFKTIILAEMKNSLMVSFTNLYRFIGNANEWKWMNSLSRIQFQQQFAAYVRLFATNLVESDASYLRACDPENGNWTRDDSFYELEGTIQATIFRYYWQPCKHFSCNMIWSQKATECETQYYTYRSVCQNDLVQCTKLGVVEACQLKSGPYKFKYVNSTELGLLGRDPTCPEDNGHIIQYQPARKSTHRTCACDCYADGNRISLAIIKSDMDKNMVITGVRFFRNHRTLYIQPREGKLSNNGRIIRYTERWVSIPEDIEESHTHPVDRMNKAFFLDDLRLPLGYVLTGVKFNKVKRENVQGFAIGIFGLPFDYESGKINNDPRVGVSQQAENDNAGMPLSFTAVSSVYTKLTHIPSPKNIKYVSLQRSTLKEDFGQLTLPLFDAVPIRLNPPSPLGGIGIFHKGVEGFAGFISLRAFGINYAYYFLHFESNHLKDGKVEFNHSYSIIEDGSEL